MRCLSRQVETFSSRRLRQSCRRRVGQGFGTVRCPRLLTSCSGLGSTAELSAGDQSSNGRRHDDLVRQLLEVDHLLVDHPPGMSNQDFAPKAPAPSRPESSIASESSSALRRQLLSALRREDRNALLRAITEAARNESVIQSLPRTTFTEMLRLLDPSFFLDPYRESWEDLSPRISKMLRLRNVREVFADFVGLIGDMVQLRRLSGSPMGLADYTALLGCARAIGNASAARLLWIDMREDGLRANLPCYNHYLATLARSTLYEDMRLRHNAGNFESNITVRVRRARNLSLPIIAPGHTSTIEEMLSVMQAMGEQGLAADEESYLALFSGLARVGDMNGIRQLLRRVWRIDLGDPDEASGGEGGDLLYREDLSKVLRRNSTFAPSTDLMAAIAFGCGINGQIQLSIRLLDLISRENSLQIPTSVWEVLVRWTYVLGSRYRRKQNRSHQSVATVPAKVLGDLWGTLIGPPYNARPSFRMYDYYIHHLSRTLQPQRCDEMMREALSIWPVPAPHTQILSQIDELHRTGEAGSTSPPPITSEPDLQCPPPADRVATEQQAAQPPLHVSEPSSIIISNSLAEPTSLADGRLTLLRHPEPEDNRIFPVGSQEGLERAKRITKVKHWIRRVLASRPPPWQKLEHERRFLPRFIEYWHDYSFRDVFYISTGGVVAFSLHGHGKNQEGPWSHAGVYTLDSYNVLRTSSSPCASSPPSASS